jgi:hypothetical protein
MEKSLTFLLLLCVVMLGGYCKWGYYYKKHYNECTPDEKRIRRVGATICGICAAIAFIIIILWSLLKK